MFKIISIVILVSFQSVAKDNCPRATEIVGENWELVEKVINMCENPNTDKVKVRKLANDVFDNLTNASKNCMQQCTKYPENYQFCKDSLRQVPSTRTEVLSNCD